MIWLLSELLAMGVLLLQSPSKTDLGTRVHICIHIYIYISFYLPTYLPIPPICHQSPVATPNAVPMDIFLTMLRFQYLTVGHYHPITNKHPLLTSCAGPLPLPAQSSSLSCLDSLLTQFSLHQSVAVSPLPHPQMPSLLAQDPTAIQTLASPYSDSDKPYWAAAIFSPCMFSLPTCAPTPCGSPQRYPPHLA